MCYQCCQYLHLLSVLFTVLCYDGSCCRSFGLHVSLATHQVSDVITFCSTFNSVRYGPILYLTIFLNSTIEVLLNHIAQFKFLNFAFFRCRNINPFSTYFAGPHYDVLHYDVYLFSAEVSLVPWQVSFKLSSLSIMHSVPILYNSTHYLHVCVAMIVSWNFSPTF